MEMNEYFSTEKKTFQNAPNSLMKTNLKRWILPTFRYHENGMVHLNNNIASKYVEKKPRWIVLLTLLMVFVYFFFFFKWPSIW